MVGIFQPAVLVDPGGYQKSGLATNLVGPCDFPLGMACCHRRNSGRLRVQCDRNPKEAPWSYQVEGGHFEGEGFARRVVGLGEVRRKKVYPP